MTDAPYSRFGEWTVASVMIASGVAATVAWIGLGVYAAWWLKDVL